MASPPPGLPAVVRDGIATLCGRFEIAAVALVGSRARGTHRPDSDVDLIVLTTSPARMLHQDDWYDAFGQGTTLIRSKGFGAIDERRLQLSDGSVVEVGVGTPRWADVDPVNDGTETIVRDGLHPLFDPAGLLARLVACVAGSAS